MEYATEDFLAHYGVKGMRWGARKTTGSSQNLTFGQKLNRSKFGEISRENVKRHTAAARAKALAESSDGTTRTRKNLRRAGKVLEVSGYAVLIGGSVYANHLLSQKGTVTLNSMPSASPAGKKAVSNLLNKPKN